MKEMLPNLDMEDLSSLWNEEVKVSTNLREIYHNFPWSKRYNTSIQFTHLAYTKRIKRPPEKSSPLLNIKAMNLFPSFLIISPDFATEILAGDYSFNLADGSHNNYQHTVYR